MTPSQILETLMSIADEDLSSMIMNAQDKAELRCEREGLRPDQWVEDAEGNKQALVYPENAAPELDQARFHILEAVELIGQVTDVVQLEVV